MVMCQGNAALRPSGPNLGTQLETQLETQEQGTDVAIEVSSSEQIRGGKSSAHSPIMAGHQANNVFSVLYQNRKSIVEYFLTSVHSKPTIRPSILRKSQTSCERGTESYGSFVRSKPLQDAKTAELPLMVA
jgi:hypothetical protein